MILGIIAALPAEANCLRKGKVTAGEALPLANGAWLCASGMGEQAVKRAFDLLLERNITHLLNPGVAGALRSECKSGDLVVPDIIRDAGGECAVDGEWRRELQGKWAAAGLPLRQGELFSADHLVSGAEARRKLAEQHDCIATDMEAAGLARLCMEHGIHFAAIKAIADEADTAMPGCILKRCDSLGRPILPAFALHALAHPSEWWSLIQIARGWRKARRSLQRACLHLGISADGNPSEAGNRR